MKEAVGFIGTGMMGDPFVRHLLRAGHPVHVFDANEAATAPLVEAGATLEADARSVAGSARIVFVSLPTPAILTEVLAGGDVLSADGLEIVVDLSTTGPSVAGTLADLARAKGVAWVDSPVSGGVSGAVNGTLAVMVASDPAAFERVKPMLALFGKLFHVGEAAGLAQIAKLGNNLLAASAMVVTSEVMAMGVKAGLDADTLIDIINAGTGKNSASEVKFPRQVVNGRFAHGFATGLSYKDVRLCVDEAEALGVPMVAGAAVRQMLSITNSMFGPKSDFTSIARVLESWADVEIRSRTGGPETTTAAAAAQ